MFCITLRTFLFLTTSDVLATVAWKPLDLINLQIDKLQVHGRVRSRPAAAMLWFRLTADWSVRTGNFLNIFHVCLCQHAITINTETRNSSNKV